MNYMKYETRMYMYVIVCVGGISHYWYVTNPIFFCVFYCVYSADFWLIALNILITTPHREQSD
jgi:hypothetical protein